jgi:hypothetical protein
MDWNQQAEDMMKTWMDTQQELWDNFFGAMQGLGKSQSARLWESTLSTGEELWKNFLKSQADWMASWVESLEGMESVPQQVVDSARQFQDMSNQWNKTQIGLIENWFAMMKNMVPVTPGDTWTDFPKYMLKSWQDTTQTIMDAQIEWMNSWMGKTGKAKDD